MFLNKGLSPLKRRECFVNLEVEVHGNIHSKDAPLWTIHRGERTLACIKDIICLNYSFASILDRRFFRLRITHGFCRRIFGKKMEPNFSFRSFFRSSCRQGRTMYVYYWLHTPSYWLYTTCSSKHTAIVWNENALVFCSVLYLSNTKI